MNKNLSENLKTEINNLEKAGDILRYSYEKCLKISINQGLSYEELDNFEALTSRFARLSDIITQKILRLFEMLDLDDKGSIRDRINNAAKKQAITNADVLIEIRILRNEIAHEYQPETVYAIFKKVMEYTPDLLKCVDSVKDYAQKHYR